ncbi:cell wall assembly regulator SMI1 [Rhodococcus sp. PvR044]|jgi:cell wall assembly regulator SMI1|uniref:SMI1/KNR4 family protein n=1 Tax=Rhodococcus sp. PvR044 TaxID=3156402 RepID=UPI0033943DAD
MTLTEAWLAYMAVLRERAPVTAAAVRPPRSAADRWEAERATTPWTDELREFFSLHDGQGESSDGTATGTVLAELTMLSLDEVVAEHEFCRETLHDTEDLGPDWADIARKQPAGTVAEMFLDAYVPFAKDGGGDYLCVDTRPGEQHGCVRPFGWEGADQGVPSFASLADYIDSLCRIVESGAGHPYLIPTIENGALIWEIDTSDVPPQEPRPDPTVMRLPFEITDFRPSQIGPDDDLVDLEVVRQTVLDTARSQYPGSVVDGGQTVFQRVPRLRGVTMNSFVSVDGETKFYLTVVTGVGNEVIVHEVPPGGFMFALGG